LTNEKGKEKGNGRRLSFGKRGDLSVTSGIVRRPRKRKKKGNYTLIGGERRPLRKEKRASRTRTHRFLLLT